LRKGWKLDVSIAVDFTISNYESNDRRSLHKFMSGGEMNMYEKALFEVCNVIKPYT
jgi:DNA repair ATPase RecN